MHSASTKSSHAARIWSNITVGSCLAVASVTSSSDGNGAPTSSARNRVTRGVASARPSFSTRRRSLCCVSSSASPVITADARLTSWAASANADPAPTGSPRAIHTSGRSTRPRSVRTISRRSRDLPSPAPAVTSSAVARGSLTLRSNAASTTASSRSRPNVGVRLPRSVRTSSVSRRPRSTPLPTSKSSPSKDGK